MEEVVLKRNFLAPPKMILPKLRPKRREDGLDRKKMVPPNEISYKAEEGYQGAHYDHFHNSSMPSEPEEPWRRTRSLALAAALPCSAMTAISRINLSTGIR